MAYNISKVQTQRVQLQLLPGLPCQQSNGRCKKETQRQQQQPTNSKQPTRAGAAATATTKAKAATDVAATAATEAAAAGGYSISGRGIHTMIKILLNFTHTKNYTICIVK